MNMPFPSSVAEVNRVDSQADTQAGCIRFFCDPYDMYNLKTYLATQYFVTGHEVHDTQKQKQCLTINDPSFISTLAQAGVRVAQDYMQLTGTRVGATPTPAASATTPIPAVAYISPNHQQTLAIRDINTHITFRLTPSNGLEITDNGPFTPNKIKSTLSVLGVDASHIDESSGHIVISPAGATQLARFQSLSLPNQQQQTATAAPTIDPQRVAGAVADLNAIGFRSSRQAGETVLTLDYSFTDESGARTYANQVLKDAGVTNSQIQSADGGGAYIQVTGEDIRTLADNGVTTAKDSLAPSAVDRW